MLAFVDENNIVQIWNGQPVSGISYQVNIGELWSDADLNTAGIYRVTEFITPPGQMLSDLNATYTLQDNVVTQTYNTVPEPVVSAATLAAKVSTVKLGATVIVA